MRSSRALLLVLLSAETVWHVQALPMMGADSHGFWNDLDLGDIIPHHEVKALSAQLAHHQDPLHTSTHATLDRPELDTAQPSSSPERPSSEGQHHSPSSDMLSISHLQRQPVPQEPPLKIDEKYTHQRLAEYQRRYAQSVAASHGHISQTDLDKAQRNLWLLSFNAERRKSDTQRNLLVTTLHDHALKRDEFLARRRRNRMGQTRQDSAKLTASAPRVPDEGAKNPSVFARHFVDPNEHVALSDVLSSKEPVPVPKGTGVDEAASGGAEHRFRERFRRSALLSSYNGDTIKRQDIHQAISMIWRLEAKNKDSGRARKEVPLEDHAEAQRRYNRTRQDQRLLQPQPKPEPAPRNDPVMIDVEHLKSTPPPQMKRLGRSSWTPMRQEHFEQRYQHALAKTKGHISDEDLRKAHSTLWALTRHARSERGPSRVPETAHSWTLHDLARENEARLEARRRWKRPDDEATAPKDGRSLQHLFTRGPPTAPIPLKAILDAKEPLPLPARAHPHAALPGSVERYRSNLRDAALVSSQNSDTVERQHLNSAMSRLWSTERRAYGKRKAQVLSLEEHAAAHNVVAGRERETKRRLRQGTGSLASVSGPSGHTPLVPGEQPASTLGHL